MGRDLPESEEELLTSPSSHTEREIAPASKYLVSILFKAFFVCLFFKFTIKLKQTPTDTKYTKLPTVQFGKQIP